MKYSNNRWSFLFKYWKIILLIIIFSLLSSLLINFIDNLYYGNLLLKEESQANSTETQLVKEKYNIKFLINNSKSQINCYDLHLRYTRNLCTIHDNSSSISN